MANPNKKDTRNNNPRLIGNLALIRDTLLTIVADHKEVYSPFPAVTEAMRADKPEAYRLIAETL